MVQIDNFEKALGYKVVIDLDNIHEGIHGYIIGLEVKTSVNLRLESKTLANLSKLKGLRWIEFESDYITTAW